MCKLRAITATQADNLLNHDPSSVLIDVRSSMEYLFVGHPVGAIHIAWIDEPDWEINPNFSQEVTSIMEKKSTDPMNSAVILICRSGQRTQQAGKILIESGFHNVMYVDEGFEGKRDNNNHRSTVGGWRYRGLPWEQC